MADPKSHGQMMNYLVRNSEDKKRMREYFETNQITTASNINRPEGAEVRQIFEDFNFRNPLADGGMLVKPGVNNTRQGYKGITEYNLEQRKKAFQELFDKHGEDTVRKAFTDETGIKNLDKILTDTDYKNQKTKDILNNFKQKFKKNIKEAGKFLPGKESRVFSRGKRVLTEQGIQIKLLEATNTKNFFDPKAFAKENNISMAKLKEQAKRLQTNIYKKRIVDSKTELGIETKDKLEWIPKDSKFSDNALTKLWKSKLIKYERNKIDEIFFDAFGRAPTKKNPNPSYNPKKFLAIKKNLNEYRQLRDAINAKYPNINFELDHPLSKSTLNKLFNATTEQLTRVNVLDSDLNNGFKDTLSLQYEKAVQDKDLNKKKAVEKIARNLKLNIGKISDDATNFKYGVKEFQKLNIKNEIVKSLENLQFLNKNFQTYAKNNPKLFEAAGVSTEQTFTKVKPSELRGIQKITQDLGKLGCPTVKFALGGRVKFNQGSACVIKGKERLESILKKAGRASPQDQVLAQGILKAGQGLKNAFALRGLLGPAAIAFTTLTEGGIVGYDMLAQGKTLKEAMGDSVFNLMLGDDYKFNNDFMSAGGTFDERLDKLRFNPQQKQIINNFRSYVREADALGQAQIDVDKAQRLLDETGNIKGRLGKDRTPTLEKNLADAMAAKEAADQSFQTRVQDLDFAKRMQSGMTEGADLMSKAIDLARLQQLGSVDQNIFGKAFEGDIAKEARRDEILKLLPTALNFAGGGIAKQAGDPSGKPPEKGPTSQGLLDILKRANKT